MTEIDTDDDTEWITACSKGKCKNDITTHRMYCLDSNKEFWLIEDELHYVAEARCAECIPASYGECFDCSKLTQRSCPIDECSVKLCKDHRNIGNDSHEWDHTGVSKHHGS